MFSAGALFPLEVVKTNLQAHTKRTTDPTNSTRTTPAAAAAAETEGETEEATGSGGRGEDLLPLSPLRVPLPPSDDHTCHAEEDGGEEEEKEQLQRQQQETQAQAQARWKSQQVTPPTVASVTRDIYSREGVTGFYNGVWYAAGQSGLEKAAYFYGYGWLKALALRGGGGGGGELSTVADLGLGYLAEVVLTKIMTSKEKTSAFAVIQGILSKNGPAGFYDGIQAYVVLCLKPAIQYAVFNRLKAITLAYRSGEHGVAGGGTKELTAVQVRY
eukprot:jgi/Undpi1/9735/HiC_scaffold_27.g12191.m1